MGKEALLGLAVPLAKDVLPKLATKATSSVLDTFERKKSGHGVVKAGKWFTLFILLTYGWYCQNPKVPGRFRVLIRSATKTVKHEIKIEEDRFHGAMMGSIASFLIAPMASSLIQPVASSLINAMSRKGVMRAGKGQQGRFLPLLALPLIMKVLEKGMTRAGKGYNNMDKSVNIFSYPPSFKQYWDYQVYQF